MVCRDPCFRVGRSSQRQLGCYAEMSGPCEQLLGSISDGFIELLPIEGSEAADIVRLMEKYKNLRPQLADAVLVYFSGSRRFRRDFYSRSAGFLGVQRRA